MSTSQQVSHDLALAAADLWRRLPASAPRVQCLTNTVGQPITANLLLAAGARVSMATHPAEIADMTRTADAVLVNLGTLDPTREQAIPVVAALCRKGRAPVVLDPVFVELSALRRSLADVVLALPAVIVRGNAAETAALMAGRPADGHVWVTTGAIDRITGPSGSAITVANGHPLMTRVTGLGCATGALVAALAALTADRELAAATALLVVGIAGERAAAACHGPADFAVRWIDAVARLDAATIVDRARIDRASAPEAPKWSQN